jgi:hypothetical protein
MFAGVVPTPAQLSRLADELHEIGLVLDGSEPWHELALPEIHYALRPRVHERRVPSFGAFVEPTVDPSGWEEPTTLMIERRPIGRRSTSAARLYADGVSSWLVRRVAGDDEWAVFDRPAGSERDLVVLANALGAAVVQRHPAGAVRIVGSFGVYRWNSVAWHHEPPVSSWIDVVGTCGGNDDRQVLEALLEFAVHDLGAWGIGATLVFRPDSELPAGVESRLPPPPDLVICRPSDLAPLRHSLTQIDGAAVVDSSGRVVHLGTRLVPSPEAETDVDSFRGMRHTSARRYSADDPKATVIVVSEDGPVTVMRGGELLGASPPT